MNRCVVQINPPSSTFEEGGFFIIDQQNGHQLWQPIIIIPEAYNHRNDSNTTLSHRKLGFFWKKIQKGL
jgi:hypothetical protein